MLTRRLFVWYCTQYPDDPQGWLIDKRATFQDLFHALQSGGNVYAVIGVGDALIRERLFVWLAELLSCPYSTIYNKWLEPLTSPALRRKAVV